MKFSIAVNYTLAATVFADSCADKVVNKIGGVSDQLGVVSRTIDNCTGESKDVLNVHQKYLN